MTFPVSGVEVSPWVPLVVGFSVSLFTSMGGVSGAFLLLPFQVSVLGFVSPAVSPTNLVYNILAIPSGVYRYVRERRVIWPLAGVMIAGTLPGMCIGVIVRLRYLPDPRAFKLFVGCVLLYVGGRLLWDLALRRSRRPTGGDAPGAPIAPASGSAPRAQGPGGRRDMSARLVVRAASFSWHRISFEFEGERHACHTLGVFSLALIVGVVSGAYGIGGGAITAPLLITVFGLPVYTVAGPVLLATFITSIFGVAFYELAAAHYTQMGLAVAPDWLLGALFGVGGAVGMYLGARCQKYVPAGVIRILLAGVLLFVAVRYVVGFWA